MSPYRPLRIEILTKNRYQQPSTLYLMTRKPSNMSQHTFPARNATRAYLRFIGARHPCLGGFTTTPSSSTTTLTRSRR